MVTFSISTRRSGGRRGRHCPRRRGPVAGQQRGQVVLIGHSRQAGEHVAQVGERVLAMATARLDERVNDRRALAGIGVTDKKPVFRAELGRADGVFHEVGVQAGAAVAQVGDQGFPLVEQVAAGLAELGFGQGEFAQAQCCATQQLQAERPMAGAQRRAQARAVESGLGPISFVEVESADQFEHKRGALRRFAERVMKHAPGVRPAAESLDLGPSARIAVVGFVTVGVEQSDVVIAKQLRQLGMPPRQSPLEHDVMARSGRAPEIALLGFAFFLPGVVVTDRCFVDLHVTVGEQVGEHAFVDRFGQIGDLAHPLRHALAGQLRTPALRHLFETKKRLVIEILAHRDPREQTGRGVTADHRPRQSGGDHRRMARVVLAPKLRAHELTFEQTRRNHIDFKGPLLGDLFVGLGIGLHLGGHDHHGLLHGQFGEGLSRGESRGAGWLPLGADRFGRRLRLGEFFEFAEVEQQLRPVQSLALAAAEEFAPEPFDLRAQHHVLLFEREVSGGQFGEGWHAWT